MSVAIDMYLKQIALKGKIPFEISVPMAPPHLNADLMTKEELIAFINEGLEDVENGNVMPFEDAFSNLREKMVKEYGLDGTV